MQWLTPDRLRRLPPPLRKQWINQRRTRKITKACEVLIKKHFGLI